MNEHENGTQAGREEEKLPRMMAVEPWARTRKGDLVLDLSGVMELDNANLAFLLTAQQEARKENRAVWLAGVSPGIWTALMGMGLGRFFRPFPQSRARAV